ncbi:hypothetical protein EVAR_92112_1 [Eumeta japonica]|uniref:Uncharacterized protein n=1 Tax=Eumeta variegata TaxID=151549 RepID=A0A4C1SZ34_EUMVA|nr:hypothetical protein EVAR_92112_1 [Eumeta japonica]
MISTGRRTRRSRRPFAARGSDTGADVTVKQELYLHANKHALDTCLRIRGAPSPGPPGDNAQPTSDRIQDRNQEQDRNRKRDWFRNRDQGEVEIKNETEVGIENRIGIGIESGTGYLHLYTHRVTPPARAPTTCPSAADVRDDRGDRLIGRHTVSTSFVKQKRISDVYGCGWCGMRRGVGGQCIVLRRVRRSAVLACPRRAMPPPSPPRRRPCITCENYCETLVVLRVEDTRVRAATLRTILTMEEVNELLKTWELEDLIPVFNSSILLGAAEHI